VTFYATDTGIFALEDALTLPPAPDAPSFSGVVADGLGNVSGLHTLADGSAADLSATDPNRAANAYDGTLSGAVDTLGAELGTAPDTQAGRAVDNGQVVDGRAAQVAPYLPGPDTGVKVGLIDPPHAPGPGDTGPGNFVTADPTKGHGGGI
jgi:hypothetical protein